MNAARSQPRKRSTRRPLTHPEIRAIVLGIMLAMFLGALDQTIVATALPTIGRRFGDLGDLSWVVTAYLLTGTAVTPLYGKLSDIHGRRADDADRRSSCSWPARSPARWRRSMSGADFSPRAAGLGGGGLMALAQTIIADIVSPRERGRYQGYIGAVFAASSVGGPVLGGFLTQHLDWSLIFWINLPLGFAALGMTSNVLKRVPFHARKHRLDVLGAALMMSASVALLLALSWGGRQFDWISPQIGALLASLGGAVGPVRLAAGGDGRAVFAAHRARQSGGALRGARRRLQHGNAGRHDDFRAALFRSGAASLRQPVRAWR